MYKECLITTDSNVSYEQYKVFHREGVTSDQCSLGGGADQNVPCVTKWQVTSVHYVPGDSVHQVPSVK